MPNLSNSTIQAQYLADPRTLLAQTLQQSASNTGAAQGGWGEAITRALSGAVAGYQGRKVREDYEAKDATARDALGKALGMQGEERTKALMGIPGYEELAVKASLEKPSFDLKGTAEQALFKMQAGQTLSQEENAALGAYDKLRSTEQMVDGRQNIVSKYQSILGGQPAPTQPALMQGERGAMPPAPTLGNGQALLPPPATGATPDQSMFPQGAMPPAGLDNKAMGVYQDETAKNAAEIQKLSQTQAMDEAKAINDRMGLARQQLVSLQRAKQFNEGSYDMPLTSQENGGVMSMMRVPETLRALNRMTPLGNDDKERNSALLEQSALENILPKVKQYFSGSQNPTETALTLRTGVPLDADKMTRGAVIDEITQPLEASIAEQEIRLRYAQQGIKAPQNVIDDELRQAGFDPQTRTRVKNDANEIPADVLQGAGEGDVIEGSDGRAFQIKNGKPVRVR